MSNGVDTSKRRARFLVWYAKNKNRVLANHRKYKESPKGAWTQFKSHKQRGRHAFLISESEFLVGAHAQVLLLLWQQR